MNLIRSLVLLAVATGAEFSRAATVGSGDWKQPQVISIRANPQGRIVFDFCPKGDLSDCQALGNRQTGYSPAEIKSLSTNARKNAEYYRYAGPLTQSLLAIGSGALFLSGGVAGIFAGGLVLSIGHSYGQDPGHSTDYWDQASRVLSEKLTRDAQFSWDLDILQFARELESILNQLPNFEVQCGCRSVYPAHTEISIPDVTGKGGEEWQARLNAEWLCSRQIEKFTGRRPGPNYRPNLSGCQTTQF